MSLARKNSVALLRFVRTTAATTPPAMTARVTMLATAISHFFRYRGRVSGDGATAATGAEIGAPHCSQKCACSGLIWPYGHIATADIIGAPHSRQNSWLSGLGSPFGQVAMTSVLSFSPALALRGSGGVHVSTRTGPPSRAIGLRFDPGTENCMASFECTFGRDRHDEPLLHETRGPASLPTGGHRAVAGQRARHQRGDDTPSSRGD